jgi:hypothetical protein
MSPFNRLNLSCCVNQDWPVGRDDCADRLVSSATPSNHLCGTLSVCMTDPLALLQDCTALGWPTDTRGSNTVCGESALLVQAGGTDMCVEEVTHAGAIALCTEVGGRLCSAPELDAGEGNPESCGYDSIFRFSWVESPDDVCPANRSLAMGGRPGEWFAFSPSVDGAHHEIRVSAGHGHDPSSGGNTISILGMFDSEAELLGGEVPTIHHSTAGMMLRWNSSFHVGSAVYFHLSSAVDSVYELAVVLPPRYTWSQGSGQTTPAPTAEVRITVLSDAATMLTLPFAFPFFGLAYTQIWVSSAGYVSFQELSTQAEPFRGVGSLYTAILAAAGQMDLTHNGAHVTKSQATEHDMEWVEIAWHAPLYRSGTMSEVSIRLRVDGSFDIAWAGIDLSNGGSLSYQLACHLAFDAAAQDALTDGTRLSGTDQSVAGTIVMGDVAERQQNAPDMRLDEASVVEAATDAVPVIVGPFYGGDDEDGLDLIGNFVYALNIAGPGGLQVQDAAFTRVNGVPGVTMSTDYRDGTFVDGVACDGVVCGAHMNYNGATAVGLIGNVDDPHDNVNPGVTFAEPLSANDYNLQLVMNSFATIMDVGVQPTVPGQGSMWFTLNVEPGVRYRLQLLFGHPRCLNEDSLIVMLDDTILVDRFSITRMQGGCYRAIVQDASHDASDSADSTHEVPSTFVRHDFTAASDTATIRVVFLTASGGTSAMSSDSGINALTLEQVDGVPAPPTTSTTDGALLLVDDAYIQLPEMVLGGAIAVSAWVKMGQMWDGNVGITLFNSFQTTTCGDSTACRNAVGETLDQNGWFAVGNDVGIKRPAGLWVAGATLTDRSKLFWEHHTDRWMMVTVSVAGRRAEVYRDGLLWTTGVLTADLPRMQRQNNYVGAPHSVPFEHKSEGITFAMNDFRLYDRSLSTEEAVSLFSDPHAPCCVTMGWRGPYGIGDEDVTAEDGASVLVSPTFPSNADRTNEDGAACEQSANVVSARELDICGELSMVSDCHGRLSDGVGPYATLRDCGILLQGPAGTTYTLSFEEMDTERDADMISVFDGDSLDAPLLGRFSGQTIPSEVRSSTQSMFIYFSSDDVGSTNKGFVAGFSCEGTPVESWRPGDVATVLDLNVPLEQALVQTGSPVCIGDSLLAVQCCADATASCANARVTEVSLEKASLRGSIPEAIGELGALRALRLHDNFLTGTLPANLNRLHLLEDLQLSRNQFLMQEPTALATILSGLTRLRTLDLSQSDESEELSKSVLHPQPPFTCRVEEPCGLTISARTSEGVQLPHGGILMYVSKAGNGGDNCACTDQMDGTYVCDFPQSWTVAAGEFLFTLAAGEYEEEFVPVRTLVDPTTGAVSTKDTYSALGVIVSPIECPDVHSSPDADGAVCICDTGYYRREYDGTYSCEHCDLGARPVDGDRCESCAFGTYSSTGESCDVCPAGQAPNHEFGAYSCQMCKDNEFSEAGEKCNPCPPGQIADHSGVFCVCPAGSYNTTRFAGSSIQCIGQHHRGALTSTAASVVCASCEGLQCIACGSDGLQVKPGWSHSSSTPDSIAPFLFECPQKELTCINEPEHRCRTGSGGLLCNVCEEGFGMINDRCEECGLVNSSPVAAISIIAGVVLALALGYEWRRRRRVSKGTLRAGVLEQQLTDNPLQTTVSSATDASMHARAERTSEDTIMIFRVLYQPVSSTVVALFVQLSDP